MSENLAVIRATFSDFRIVKGRKQAQLIFELPLEQAQDAVLKLGMPNPSEPAWCAIALLDMAKTQEPQSSAKSEAAKKAYRDMPEWKKAATRCVMLCKDGRFQDWLRDKQRRGRNWSNLDREQVTAGCLKDQLRIESRSEIATDERAYQAFIALEQEFRMATGQAAEVRG